MSVVHFPVGSLFSGMKPICGAEVDLEERPDYAYDESLVSCPKCRRELNRIEMEQSRKFDQSSAFAAENFPRFWKRMYDECIKEGFSQEQAMDILICYIGVCGRE